MLTFPRPSSPHKAVRFGALLCLAAVLSLVPLVGAGQPPQKSPSLPKVFDKPIPENLDDLKLIQEHVAKLAQKVMPAVVNVKMPGKGQGSGVIITADGYVLTAGHVSATPNKDFILIMTDGRTVKAKSLGANRQIDSGLIKITEEGKWPHVEMGRSGELKRGEWVMAIGHPGGLQKGRTPPVRLGRVLESSNSLVRSDCTLVGGDSGGPLFDMNGRVVGIHSRIGQQFLQNIHVPVDTYRDTWERLAKGEYWGDKGKGKGKKDEPPPAPKGDPWLGVVQDPDAKDCRISDIQPNSPAAKAGLKSGDVIVSFAGNKVATFDELVTQVGRTNPGQQVAVQVRRGEETTTIQVTIGTRPKNE